MKDKIFSVIFALLSGLVMLSIGQILDGWVGATWTAFGAALLVVVTGATLIDMARLILRR